MPLGDSPYDPPATPRMLVAIRETERAIQRNNEARREREIATLIRWWQQGEEEEAA